MDRSDSPNAPDRRRLDALARAALSAGALQTVADTLEGSIVVLDRVGVVRLVGETVSALLGHPEDAVVGRNGFELVHPADLDMAVDLFDRTTRRAPDTRRTTLRLRTGAGDDRDPAAWRWVEVFARNALDNPQVDGLVLSVRDVHAVVESEQHTRRLVDVMGATTDLVVMLDRAFRVTWANAAASKWLPHDAIARGVRLDERVPRWVTRAFVEEILPLLRAGGTWSGEVSMLDRKDRARRIDATVVLHRDPSGRTDFMSIVGRDISNRLELERKLNIQSRTDPLTGVGNRQAALDGIDRAAHLGSVGVTVIDIEGFKAVNDSHGHAVGDLVLAEVGRRLRSQVWSSQLVARLGDDEFAVIWPAAGSFESTVALGRRLLDDVGGMLALGDVTLSLQLRAGVSFGREGTTSALLLREATKALSRAKELGAVDVVGYDDELRALTEHRAAIAREIPSAIEADQFESWFQPLIDARTGAVSSFEALVRWDHPVRGLVFPDVFIPVAEETGSIVDVGAAVIRRACHHAATWRQREELADVRVAVNVSARQLADPGLVAILEQSLSDAGLAPHSLTVEITESLLMTDFDAASVLLEDLRMVGVEVAIDDFGTGYSSLAYLQQLPIDVLKIDRRFVSPLGDHSLADYSLVAGIVSIGKSLGLSVVAEGVETESQAAVLRELGVDTLQGYLYSRPLPPQDVLQWWGAASDRQRGN